MSAASWRLRASVKLDDLERTSSSRVPSVSEFASSLGVSRQTIWRDKNLLLRLKGVRDGRATGAGTVNSRRSVDQRIAALEAENAELKQANNVLLLNFMRIAQKLRENNIDPFRIMGSGALNIRSMSDEHLEDD